MCWRLGSSLLTEERSGIKSSTESDRVVQSDGLYVRRDNARLGPVRKRNNCLAGYSGFDRYYLAYLEGAIADDSFEFESSGTAVEPKSQTKKRILSCEIQPRPKYITNAYASRLLVCLGLGPLC